MRNNLKQTRGFWFILLLALFTGVLFSCHRQNATGSVVVSSDAEKEEKADRGRNDPSRNFHFDIPPAKRSRPLG